MVLSASLSFDSKLEFENIASRVADELGYLLQNSEYTMLNCGGTDNYVHKKSFGDVQNVLSMDFGGSTIKYAVVRKGSLDVLYKFQYEITRRSVDHRFFEEIISSALKDVNMIKGFFSVQRYVPVVVTFSFPLDSNYRIKSMGKGYHLRSEIKECNLVEILQKCFSELNNAGLPPFTVVNIVNDSVAVYQCNNSQNIQSDISLVLGTGINACFRLPKDRLPGWKKPDDGQNYYLINSEIGFLGEGYLPLTRYDYGYHFKADPFMPCEFLTSGKWISFSLMQILKQNKIDTHGIAEWDGLKICQALDGRMAVSDQVINIIQQLIRRAANIICGLILGIETFLKGPDLTNVDNEIHVSYVGSFLHKCHYYREQISKLSRQRIKFHFLDDSNLLGSVVTLLN